MEKPLVKNTKGLIERLEDQQNHFENTRIEKVFSSLDELFQAIHIKIQHIDNNNNLSKEQYSNLYDFLAGSKDKNEITNIIKSQISHSIDEKEWLEIFNNKEQSLFFVVKQLWHNERLSAEDAQKILAKQCPLNSSEIIRLIENSIVKTESGYLIQLRTGSEYGNALKLFDDINEAIKFETKNSSEHINLENIIDNKTIKNILENKNLDHEKTLSDAQLIQAMRRYMIFISSIGLPIRMRPNTATFGVTGNPSFVRVNNHNNTSFILSPQTLSISLIGNHYFKHSNSSLSNGIFVNPIGVSYSGTMSFLDHGANWWLLYTDGYLGGGINYTVNFDHGTFWSSGQSTMLNIGLMSSAWKNYLSAGISLQTLVRQGIGLGLNASITINRSHDVFYKGQYPLDGKFPQIRGLHKIEINDLRGTSKSFTLEANLLSSQVPISVAFRAGVHHTLKRVYRTHVDLKNAQRMLKEADFNGISYILGKKIKETKIPSFLNPDQLIEGDELVETKFGKLSGAFVMGLESLVPISAARLGATVELSGEFVLGLKKLPNEKYEVSIEPSRVIEMGIFASAVNIIGAGYVKGISIARKQILVFDFKESEAKRAYFDLIYHGRLPSSEEIEISSDDRGPEYLLTEFREQNKALIPRGIERIYLEKIRIHTKKKNIGINAPVVPAILYLINKIDKKTRPSKKRINLRFEGIDCNFVQSEADSVATNGFISVRRMTYGGGLSKGQGHSGKYNRFLFVTHRRIHSIDDVPLVNAENRWQFDSLVVHAQLEDTIITGDEENKMANKINKLFGTYIESFSWKNSKEARIINIERDFTRNDLANLVTKEAEERVNHASEASGIDRSHIINLINEMKQKHPDHQGLLLKNFIESHKGFRGFAAAHQLLGAKAEDLFIRTEAGYNTAINNAKQFIAEYTDFDSKTTKINLSNHNNLQNRKKTNEFFIARKQHLRIIDQQLRLLNDDKYLIDDKNQMYKIFSKEKVEQLIKSGARQNKIVLKSGLIATRKSITELMNLKNQGFRKQERTKFYKLAKKKYLTILEKAELIYNKYSHIKISNSLSKDEIRKRFNKCWKIIDSLAKRREKVEKDELMAVMDHDYVQERLRLLKKWQEKITALLSLDHLSEKEAQSVREKFVKKEHGFMHFFHKKHDQEQKIAGAFSQTLYQKSQGLKPKLIRLNSSIAKPFIEKSKNNTKVLRKSLGDI